MNRFQKAKERADAAVYSKPIRHNPKKDEKKVVIDSKNVIEFRR